MESRYDSRLGREWQRLLIWPEVEDPNMEGDGLRCWGAVNLELCWVSTTATRASNHDRVSNPFRHVQCLSSCIVSSGLCDLLNAKFMGFCYQRCCLPFMRILPSLATFEYFVCFVAEDWSPSTQIQWFQVMKNKNLANPCFRIVSRLTRELWFLHRR